jgi:hypothetical protein
MTLSKYTVYVLKTVSDRVEIEAPSAEVARALVKEGLGDWPDHGKDGGSLFSEFHSEETWPIEVTGPGYFPGTFYVTTQEFLEKAKEHFKDKPSVRVLVSGSPEHLELEAVQEAVRKAENLKWWENRVKDLEADLKAARGYVERLRG